MKELFLPYLKELFPLLEKYLVADIDFKVEDGALNEFVDSKSSKTDVNYYFLYFRMSIKFL